MIRDRVQWLFRRPARWVAVASLCLLLGLACKPFYILVQRVLLDPPVCSNQASTFYKIVGGNFFQIGFFQNAFCALSGASGWFGNPAVNFTVDSWTNESSVMYRRSVAVGTNATLDAAPSTETLQMESQALYQLLYAPATGSGSAPELWVKAVPVNLGAGAGDTVTGSVDVDVDGSVQTVQADGLYHFFSLGLVGGNVSLTPKSTAKRKTQGTVFQGTAVSYGIRYDSCMHDYECEVALGPGYFCTNFGCAQGGSGEPCDNTKDCNSGLACGPTNQCVPETPLLR